MDNCWSDGELRQEMLSGLEKCTPYFRRQLRQILLDMRLQSESYESVLTMVSKLLAKSGSQNCSVFLQNTERIAFDTRLATQYDDVLVSFLKQNSHLR